MICSAAHPPSCACQAVAPVWFPARPGPACPPASRPRRLLLGFHALMALCLAHPIAVLVIYNIE